MGDLQEARRLLEEAEKSVKPGRWLFFSTSTDYYQSAELFNRAANAFKACREWREAGDAFRRGAEMETKTGEADESARKLLNAASCYKKCDPSLAVSVIQEALGTLLRAGRFHLAAAHEKEIAEIYETQLDQPTLAMEYYLKAAERYAGEDSGSMAQSCKIKAATLGALSGEYEKSAMIFEEAASDSVNDQLRKYSVRDYLLRAGLCRLCGDDLIGGKRTIESYLGIDAAFGSGKEFKLLTDIIDALEKEDGEAFTEGVTEFDRTNSLDDWKTRILLRIKNNFENEDEGLA